jgi:hypothetical protein
LKLQAEQANAKEAAMHPIGRPLPMPRIERSIWMLLPDRVAELGASRK